MAEELEKTDIRPPSYKGRILLVDDNYINQEVGKTILTKFGFEIVVAENGLDALKSIKKGKFDAVLMDLQMPIMDGYEATVKIREDPNNKHLPIIAMTAHAFAGEKERCFSLGMNEYLNKPFNPKELNEILTRWIDLQTEQAKSKDKNSSIVKEDSVLGLNLPGIDTRILQEYSVDITLLEKLFSSFQQSFSNIEVQLKQFFKTKNYDEASKLLHSLKGASGNLGAVEVHEGCKKLEDAIKNNSQRDIQHFQRELIEDLLQVFQTSEYLKVQLKTLSKKNPVQKNIDIEHCLKKLYSLIQRSSFDVDYGLLKLKNASGIQSESQEFNQLSTYLDVFDYKNAKVELKKMAKNLDIFFDDSDL